jgi:ribosomal protein RSM22 (predicted rRNA methylase)
MLWNRLSPNGVFIVVEPGSPKGFRFIHDLRTWVLQKTREEASIVAPCPNHQECPLKTKGWCHFSQMGLKFPNTVKNNDKIRSFQNLT